MRISDWSSDVCSSDLVDRVEALRTGAALHPRQCAALGRAQPLIGQRQMINLCLHDPGDLSVTLGAAPDLSFRPQRMLAQFVNGRMVVARGLVGQWQV